MNCSNCKTPGAPHELINGLCHRCTAEKMTQLQSWKDEVLAVESGWDEQEVASLLCIKLGEPIRPAIAPAIRSLLGENLRRVLQFEEAFKRKTESYLLREAGLRQLVETERAEKLKSWEECKSLRASCSAFLSSSKRLDLPEDPEHKLPDLNKQPKWKLVAQIGDVNWIKEGGLFVYQDETGVYPPEMIWVVPLPEGSTQTWKVWHVVLEPCTLTDCILSDNKFHPLTPAWFAGSLNSIAGFIGQPVDELTLWFLSDDLCLRARAWEAVGDYHGWDNLDPYPAVIRDRAELKNLAAVLAGVVVPDGD